MIIINMDDRDLANIRFSYSPLAELTLSYRLLRKGDWHHRRWQHAWLDDAQQKLDGVHLPYMDAVIEPSKFIPDFVIPPVGGTVTRIEEQLKTLSDVPADLIVRDMQTLVDERGMSEERYQFIKDPHAALPCLVEEMWYYWQLVLESHWSRIASTLEGDVLYRARQMAQQGVTTVLQDINTQLTYPQQDKLFMDKDEDCVSTSLEGRGLQFYPTLFKPGLLWQVGNDWQPSIGYAARGAGVWYQPPEIDTDEAIELTLGASKARLLTVLKEPNATTDLAHMLHLSAGAVSQQLTRMTKAGLVISNRSGNRVYYRLSQRGEQLLDVFGA